ncbi:metallophosphoesterase [Tumebacillus permanentifrigoris]|uniref:Calcineurin-like phosphoesterase domain-containing protein n=1 Tax=Tumebacillus permanentifrigoris TaxID=378543 RepID=A0A316DBQ0_9BACL|nr:metallophosphoesterase [Tumebacillus permanentifrigoris]PWK14512.1 hypothetical protein C7459_105279 [Tumebacillus permanentifrigoris]
MIWFLLLIAVLLLLAVLAEVIWETSFPKVVEVTIPTPKLQRGQELRILQVTDIHNLRWSEGFWQQMQGTKPDLIAMTGDLIDGANIPFDLAFSQIERLKTIAPDVLFVTGNNDWEHKRFDDYLAGLRARGVTLMDNTSMTLATPVGDLQIVGVGDACTHHHDIHQAMQNVTPDERFLLLLSHDPMIIRRGAGLERAADLILSGHTHGGQVRFPLLGAVYAPTQGLFPKYDKGLFQLDETTRLYICSGLGTSRFPIRFLNRAQVTLVKLVGA